MILNRLHILLTALMLSVIAAGCGDNAFDRLPEPVPGAPGTLTIIFKRTALTRSAESDQSESFIDNVTIALYPDDPAEDVAPACVKSFSGVTNTVVDNQVTSTVTMYLTDEMIQTLFANTSGRKCRVYAVANYQGAIPEDATIAQLKALTVASDFKNTQVQTSFVMFGEDGEATYTGPASGNTVGSAAGSCNLTRAAAKINLNVLLPPSITATNSAGKEETWEPVTGERQMWAYINNGVQSAIAYPVTNTDGTPWKPSAIEAYYNSDPTKELTYRFLSDAGTQTVNGVTHDKFGMSVPFYTYPNAWSQNVIEDTSQTTLTLIVRWKKHNENYWANYYYQVPVTPTDLFQIDRNHAYTINLTVGMLGSIVPETPLKVEDATYQVINWGNEQVDVNINDYRYLVVNPNVVSVLNEADVEIPFYSSHSVDIQNITMTFQRFNFYSNGNGEVVDIVVPKGKLDASVNGTGASQEKMVSYEIADGANGQKVIKLHHALEIWNAVNDRGNTITFTGNSGTGQQTLTNVTNSIVRFEKPDDPETPFSSYVFKLHIQHHDNASYSEDITITQYPGMYIEAKRNPGNGASNHNAGGNVFVNNGYHTVNYNYYLGNVTTQMGASAQNNANPNMYVITVTQLDASSKYQLGDPRTQYYNNNLTTNNNASLTTPTTNGNPAGARTGNVNYATNQNWCASSPALYPVGTGNRTLSYYYPTIEDESYKYRIAPKFRVASSYGKTQTLSRNGARRRMATYQELNCPAGRWRLPTYGELEFIISLSSTGKIPELYSVGYYYWTAQGPCLINNDGTITLANVNTNNVSVRGVYDEWYWENYPQYVITPTNNRYTYTLGDVPRGAQ